MFCHRCGAQAAPGQSFCPQCGTRLETSGGSPLTPEPGRSAFGSGSQTPQPVVVVEQHGWSTLTQQTRVIIIAVAAAVMVVALVLGIVVTSSRGVLYRAATACGTETSDYDEYVDRGQAVYSSGSRVMILSDDHQSLAIMSDDIPDCVFDNIGMPDEIMTRFNDTSSSDGMMSDSFDRFDISWYYDGSRLYTVLTRKGLL